MSSTSSTLVQMMSRVALALGDDIIKKVAFVGGCTTALHVTDSFTKEHIRFTEDVDLIIDVATYGDWQELLSSLQSKGFHLSMEDEVFCRLRLGELIVDFMPDTDVFGFTNRWYKDALQAAQPYQLSDTIQIMLIQPVYFVATKLEAYKGRGNNDPLGSRDAEDIINIFDGRPEIVDEILQSSDDLKEYISLEMDQLTQHDDFNYAVQSAAIGDSGRIDVIYERLEAVSKNHSLL